VPLVNSILGADLPRISNYIDFQKTCNKMDRSKILSLFRFHKKKKIW